MKQHDEGFTLIELLIVIVILGILAAVVVVAVGGITGDSEANACQAEKRTVLSAMEAYRADNGSYPTSLTDIVGTAAISNGGYLRSNPKYWDVGTSGSIVAAVTLPAGCA